MKKLIEYVHDVGLLVTRCIYDITLWKTDVIGGKSMNEMLMILEDKVWPFVLFILILFFLNSSHNELFSDGHYLVYISSLGGIKD